MKKAVALLSLSVFVCTIAFAENMDGPDAARKMHREEMKKVKQEMRANRPAKETPKEPTKMDKFWQKEGERSGLGNTGERAGNWVKNLNPMPFFKNQEEQYKARKAAAGTK